jgi:hypothetical protein
MAESNQLSFDIKVGGNAEQSIGNVKKALKEANAELINAQSNFGDYSKEAIEAAKRVAELKDKISEARETADLFDPGKKFQALAGAATAVAGGFTAVQGALGLIGVESEEVEKSLLKVQSALALSQGLSTITDSVKDFERLGKVIQSTTAFQTAYNFVIGKKVAIQAQDTATTVASTVATKAQAAATNTATVATTASSTAMKVLRGAILATGIGALVIALGLVIANFGKIKTAILNAIPGLGKFASTVGNVINAFTDLIGVTNAASRAEQQRQAIFTKAAAGTKIINEGIDRQIKLLQAQGAEQGKLDALRKQQINNELNDLKKLADQKGILRGEDAKKYKDLQNDLQVIDATAQKTREDAAKQAAQRGAANTNKYGETAKKKADQELEEFNERIEKQLEEEKQLTEDLLSEYDKRNKFRLTSRTITQQEIAALDKAEAEENKKKQEAIDNERFAGQKAVMAATTNFTLQSIQTQQAAAATEAQIEKQKTADKLKELELQKAGAMAALDAVAGIIDQNSVAGKAIAVAKAVMSTYEGATKALGAYPPPFGAIAAAATVAAGLVNVKKIISTNIPSARGTGSVGGGVSAPSISAGAPMAPPQPQAQTTSLNTQTINALGNQATRAYVIESDVTSSQQRIAAIQQRARFG